MSAELAPGTLLQAPPDAVYTAEFAGRRIELHEQRQTFRVSRAGIALGEFLIGDLTEGELRGRILDLGTGSGAIAILLRALGATSVCATDVSQVAVQTARRNELLNFAAPEIDFQHGDLFDIARDASDGLFDMVVFNPPGWRTPSPALKAQLDGLDTGLEADAMFYGETILLKFLLELPGHLSPGGRAIVGLNSLLGVRDLLQSAADSAAPACLRAPGCSGRARS
jgi:release factor glutamine methyltransferase